jgi:hypothetical protein
MECNGLATIDELGIFSSTSSLETLYSEAVVSALQVASHLIRSSEEYLDVVQTVLTPEKLGGILLAVFSFDLLSTAAALTFLNYSMYCIGRRLCICKS